MATRREDALEQQLNNSDEPPEGLDDPPHVDLPELIRLFDEEGFRREAYTYKTSDHTLHLWRAFRRARRLGAELSALPWFLTYLDRVAERFDVDPQSDKKVAEIFELTGANRRPAYDDTHDRLAGAVLRWRGDNPDGKLDTAFAKVAERFTSEELRQTVTPGMVKHAYYDWMKKVWKLQNSDE